VNTYRQSLRRDLLNTHHSRTFAVSYRKAFYVSLGLSSVFAVILALFILRPEIPGRVHHAFRSDRSVLLTANNPFEKQKEQTSTYILSKNDFNTILPDGFDQLHLQDLDKIFVKLVSESRLKRTPIKIEPIAPSEIYSVNQFRLDDGNSVIVYTQFPAENINRESY
jgi:hypothetical protein